MERLLEPDRVQVITTIIVHAPAGKRGRDLVRMRKEIDDVSTALHDTN